MPELHCILVTPEKTVLDDRVDFIALPLYDGEIGIAPGHTPMIGRLGCGEMRLKRDRTIRRYYVEGGFVEVLEDAVSVLTSRAVPAEQLDAAVVREQLQAARTRPATTPDLLAARDRAVAQARAQLRVARRAGQA